MAKAEMAGERNNRKIMKSEEYNAEEINIGFHPEGFRIDKTASPLNRYTKWSIGEDGEWRNPGPVCFHSLPENGWRKAERFDWNEPD